MSESQKIAELRSLLTQLDQPKQVAEALPLLAPAAMAGARAAAPAVARGAVSLAGKAKNAFQNFKAGMAGQRARTPAGTYTQAGGATKAGQAVKNNAGKAAAAGAAAAGAAGYMAGKAAGAATKPAASAATKPAAGAATKPAAAPAAAPATTLTPQEVG
jgi:hypothetical protein